jgi:hypothetical protein
MPFPFCLAVRRDTYGHDDFSPNGRHSAIVTQAPLGSKAGIQSALSPAADPARRTQYSVDGMDG